MEGLAFWPGYLLIETFGLTSERKRLINVSDGGHTGDNVGIYPLFERRCQVIIACGAEADATLSFGSFTEALRHAYVDLGVDVDIDLSMIKPDPVTGLSKSQCAIGRIRYPECPERPGWLIYLKNSLSGDEPAPVLNYKRSCVDFPHESTADQFFDDAQFESYRALGVHIAEHAFGSWISDPDVKRALAHEPRSPERIGPWQDLVIRHSPFRAAEEQDFQELTRQLSALEKLFLETPALRAYYAECMDLSTEGVPAIARFIRRSRQRRLRVPELVHVCAMQIQLMEDVYFSLRLDQYANARDNRGWMNLFRRWGNSATFRKYFKQLRSTFSNDVVDFYCRYIDLCPPIDEAPIPHAWDVTSADRQRGVRGVFLDPGRRETGAPGEPDVVREPERTTPGQHGESTGLIGETTPPSPDAGGQ